MKILIVRHGESDNNKSKTLTGQYDGELSNLGVTQGKLVSEYIYKNYKNIYKIYSSPLKRAKDTIKNLSIKANVLIIEEKKLMEIDGGV